MLYIRFHTGAQSPNNGFHARVKIGVCGGTRYIGKGGSEVLRSPDYPANYRSNVHCDWMLRGPPGHFLSFTFQKVIYSRCLCYLIICFQFDLSPNFNCSMGDYLRVRHPKIHTFSDTCEIYVNLYHICNGFHDQIEEANATEPIVANMCGPGPLAPLDTSGNTAKYSSGPATT